MWDKIFQSLDIERCIKEIPNFSQWLFDYVMFGKGNKKTKVFFKCKVINHGSYTQPIANFLNARQGCKVCVRDDLSKRKREYHNNNAYVSKVKNRSVNDFKRDILIDKSIKKYGNKLKQLIDNILSYNQKVASHKTLLFRCPLPSHNGVYEQQVRHYFSGYEKCPKCIKSPRFKAANTDHNLEKRVPVINRYWDRTDNPPANTVLPNENKIKYTLHCYCGVMWEDTPNNVVHKYERSGIVCSKCKDTFKPNTKYPLFQEKLKKQINHDEANRRGLILKDIYPCAEAIRIPVDCFSCSSMFDIWPSQLSGCNVWRCDNCNPKGISKIEFILFKVVQYLFPCARKLQSIGKNTELDIYIEKYNVAIEYDGYRWHKNKKMDDIEKIQYYINKGITIINIREDKLDLLNKYSICYKWSLEPLHIKSLIDSIMCTVNLILIEKGDGSCSDMRQISLEKIIKIKHNAELHNWNMLGLFEHC